MDACGIDNPSPGCTGPRDKLYLEILRVLAMRKVQEDVDLGNSLDPRTFKVGPYVEMAH